MFILDFDIIGTLIFLWFIFKGIRDSQQAKKKHAERQRNPRVGRSTPARGTTQPKPREFEPARPVFPQERRRPKQPVFPTFEPETVPPVKTFTEEPKKVNQVIQKAKVEKKPQDIMEDNYVIDVEDLEQQNQNTLLPLESQIVVDGIIWSEILGPPRAKRKYKTGIY